MAGARQLLEELIESSIVTSCAEEERAGTQNLPRNRAEDRDCDELPDLKSVGRIPNEFDTTDDDEQGAIIGNAPKGVILENHSDEVTRQAYLRILEQAKLGDGGGEEAIGAEKAG
ncbi:hypothetical protein TorRG33x02_082390 [Trema orientale]|uniref:Uncharacterized protein n=1 Tax=Trema orientale TaxID=63057 RepID=A0A2P5FDX7_TREOI|nr:hypothetical protein TorRG33x02_082390 [Trema orientale]